MDIKNRKVKMFRCHLDPAIGARAKNAFMVGQDGVKSAELCPVGVYVEWVNPSPGNSHDVIEHLVPFSNIQSIKLAPAEAVEEIKETKLARAK